MADRSLYVVGVFLLLLVGFSVKDLVIGLDNGLALTPPSKFFDLENEIVSIWKPYITYFELMCLQAVQ